MEKTRFGYCCINLTLQQQKGITIGRGMIKRTFEQKGISYASELALNNVRDLIEIINGIINTASSCTECLLI